MKPVTIPLDGTKIKFESPCKIGTPMALKTLVMSLHPAKIHHYKAEHFIEKTTAGAHSLRMTNSVNLPHIQLHVNLSPHAEFIGKSGADST